MSFRLKILILVVLLVAVFWAGLYHLGVWLHTTGTIVSAFGLAATLVAIAIASLGVLAYLVIEVFGPPQPLQWKKYKATKGP